MNGTQRTALIVWGSLLWAMILYGVIAFVAKRDGTPPEGPIVLVLGAVAGPLGVAALVVHRLLTSPDRVLAFARQAAGGSKESVARAAWERWRGMNILAWALGESTALFGLVGALVKNDAMVIVPFLIYGLVIHGLMFPRAGALSEKLRDLG